MFNFDDVKVEVGTGNRYISPGISEVVVKEYKVGINSANNAYIEVTVADDNGATCTNRYGLLATVREGKKNSAWDITQKQLFKLMLACGNKEEDIKKKMRTVTTPEQLAETISALTVGKRVRMKFDGEEIQGSEGKKSWIKTIFGMWEFVESVTTNPTTLRFDEKKNIKKLPTIVVETVKEDWSI